MLQLNNGFLIDADRAGYSLHQVRKIKTQDYIKTYIKTSDVTIGYFGSLSDALDGYVKAAVRQHVQDTSTDLKQVRKLLKKLHDEISRVNA